MSRTTTRLSALVIASVAAVALAGCSDGGPRTTDVREVAEFTSVANDSSADVRIRVGEPQHVQVVAPENAVSDVRTEVRDGTLHVSFGSHDPDHVTVEIDVPSVDSLENAGSGDVEAKGVDADTLTVQADGSGNLELAGKARQLTVDQSGSGDLDLGDLSASDARVRTKGSGDTKLWVDAALDLRTDGSGDVEYRGDPALTKHLKGSGDVGRAD
ncbi:head GIN domain-containing protein [Aeromicrobium sp. 9AM]|uniref:head GIN domain-containing protein n=1 Tax=Aeromicrobium sp. 9AM TaxID=2653126 RepID=UPI0012F02873|nr:head GIN domain-containing protein [Aeromicrobium sp. 9AM]VXB84201.1 conserved exported hypothetical protein [Aeromicrobium sp. 9AM]